VSQKEIGCKTVVYTRIILKTDLRAALFVGLWVLRTLRNAVMATKLQVPILYIPQCAAIAQYCLLEPSYLVGWSVSRKCSSQNFDTLLLPHDTMLSCRRLTFRRDPSTLP
jgi:hypothetical protein